MRRELIIFSFLLLCYITALKHARWSFIYPSLAYFQTMKLVSIYTPLYIFLCNIFVEKGKYHRL